MRVITQTEKDTSAQVAKMIKEKLGSPSSKVHSNDHRVMWVYDAKAYNDKHTSTNPGRPFKYLPALEAMVLLLQPGCSVQSVVPQQFALRSSTSL